MPKNRDEIEIEADCDELLSLIASNPGKRTMWFMDCLGWTRSICYVALRRLLVSELVNKEIRGRVGYWYPVRNSVLDNFVWKPTRPGMKAAHETD